MGKMERKKSTLLNEQGHLLSTYSFIFHLLGLWLPLIYIAFRFTNFNGIYVLIAIVITIFSFIPFAIMRIMLKFLQQLTENILLKFMLWLLAGEFSAFLFYMGLVIRNKPLNWAKFVDWHFDTVPLIMFFFPHYATVVGGFLVEFYYKDKEPDYNNDILDDTTEL